VVWINPPPSVIDAKPDTFSMAASMEKASSFLQRLDTADGTDKMYDAERLCRR
jgi:hypothetical protein